MANLGYIQVSRVCNQKCLFCSNPENNRMIELEEASKLFADLIAGGYDGVILTGGEPTVHPQLDVLVKEAKESGLFVRIITNGQNTAKPGYLEHLVQNGLSHLHVSVHSFREKVQAYLSSNPDSLGNIMKTLERVGELGITCDINTVICAQNADHLDENIRTVNERFPFINHFVFNNIDPKMNRVAENPHTVARLADVELSLFRALSLLDDAGRTYRVERLPLCYMVEFAHASTETRKIVKQEERTVHFLDDKGRVRQTDFFHQKAECCRVCTLDSICAGLYDMGGAYRAEELYPVFVDPQRIIGRINKVL